MQTRILLIDGDASFGAQTQAGLRSHQYDVVWVHDCDAAELMLQQVGFDLLLLELRLPLQSGLDFLARYGARHECAPIIVLSATSETGDRIRTLDAGADDYLCKPFDLGELCAHIRVVLRRPLRGAGPQQIHHQGITLDLARYEVFCHGTRIDLQRRQFTVLQALMNHPGHVVTRGELEKQIYGQQEEPLSNAVAVFIHELREKLGSDSILTVRGIGYRLAD